MSYCTYNCLFIPYQNVFWKKIILIFTFLCTKNGGKNLSRMPRKDLSIIPCGSRTLCWISHRINIVLHPPEKRMHTLNKMSHFRREPTPQRLQSNNLAPKVSTLRHEKTFHIGNCGQKNKHHHQVGIHFELLFFGETFIFFSCWKNAESDLAKFEVCKKRWIVGQGQKHCGLKWYVVSKFGQRCRN